MNNWYEKLEKAIQKLPVFALLEMIEAYLCVKDRTL